VLDRIGRSPEIWIRDPLHPVGATPSKAGAGKGLIRRAAKLLFQSIILASCAIPGMLPPVMINVHARGTVEREAHIDGGLTLPFFIAPSPADLPMAAPDGHSTEIRVIINGRLNAISTVTKASALSIFRRSISTVLASLMKSTLEHFAEASRVRGVDLKYTAIPASYPLGDGFNFAAAAQRSLFQYAAACARTDRLWSSTRGVSVAEARHLESGPGAQCPAEDSYFARMGAEDNSSGNAEQKKVWPRTSQEMPRLLGG
jgi:hypothetical protein